MAVIRAATDDDIPGLVVLGLEFCSVHPLANLIGYDAEALQRTVTLLMQDVNSCVLVADAGQGLAGGILGTIAPLFFSQHARAACEVAWFVAEPFRRSRVALHLFAAFEAWGQAAQVQAFIVSSLPQTAGLDALYARHGYRAYETQYGKGQQPWL